MREVIYDAPQRTTSGAIWQVSAREYVLWCYSGGLWRQAKGWSFAKPYAVAERNGFVVERAYLIPASKKALAFRALGLPLPKWKPTPRQAAYHAQLRTEGPSSRLRPNASVRERRYFDRKIAAGGTR